VGEADPGSERGGFECAVLVTSVPSAVLPVTCGNGAPGKVLDLGVQAGLILLHHQDVVGFLLVDQELRVLALGVQGVIKPDITPLCRGPAVTVQAGYAHATGGLPARQK
jgi:hypothetical protein